MPKVFTSKSQRTGERGEQIAVKYLENNGFSILERNYTKKWGEIDIIALKGNKVHFIEVKSKTVFDFKPLKADSYRPEDGMHPWKIQRLKRTLQTYLLERNVLGEWQFDLITVYLNDERREAMVKMLDDIVL
jgi:putative endonuclease